MKKIQTYFVQSICLCILAITYLPNINILANNKVLAQTTNADEPSILETQTSTSNRLQKLLIEQNKPEAALEISERSRNRALVDILSDRSSSSVVKPLSTEQLNKLLNNKMLHLFNIQSLMMNSTLKAKSKLENQNCIFG